MWGIACIRWKNSGIHCHVEAYNTAMLKIALAQTEYARRMLDVRYSHIVWLI